MAFGASRSVKTVKKEVLKFPAGLDAIESVVLRASGVPELASAVTGVTGKIGLRAGTILKRISGDSQNRYEEYDGSGTIEGILGDNVEFYDNTSASDTPVDMLFHGCAFNYNKIIGYDDYETELKAALTTCVFLEGEE